MDYKKQKYSGCESELQQGAEIQFYPQAFGGRKKCQNRLNFSLEGDTEREKAAKG